MYIDKCAVAEGGWAVGASMTWVVMIRRRTHGGRGGKEPRAIVRIYFYLVNSDRTYCTWYASTLTDIIRTIIRIISCTRILCICVQRSQYLFVDYIVRRDNISLFLSSQYGVSNESFEFLGGAVVRRPGRGQAAAGLVLRNLWFRNLNCTGISYVNLFLRCWWRRTHHYPGKAAPLTRRGIFSARVATPTRPRWCLHPSPADTTK